MNDKFIVRDFENFIWSKLKLGQFTGNIAKLKYKGRELFIQTPIMITPFGWKSDWGSLSLSFVDKNISKPLARFWSFLDKLDEKLSANLSANHEYLDCIRVDKCNSEYTTIKANDKQTNVFDWTEKIVDIGEIKSGCYLMCIIKVAGLWQRGNSVGCILQAQQIQIVANFRSSTLVMSPFDYASDGRFGVEGELPNVLMFAAGGNTNNDPLPLCVSLPPLPPPPPPPPPPPFVMALPNTRNFIIGKGSKKATTTSTNTQQRPPSLNEILSALGGLKKAPKSPRNPITILRSPKILRDIELRGKYPAIDDD